MDVSKKSWTTYTWVVFHGELEKRGLSFWNEREVVEKPTQCWWHREFWWDLIPQYGNRDLGLFSINRNLFLKASKRLETVHNFYDRLGRHFDIDFLLGFVKGWIRILDVTNIELWLWLVSDCVVKDMGLSWQKILLLDTRRKTRKSYF